MSIADLSAFRSVHVTVLGDVMLDHYVEGSVTRVSDEAPVPILRVARERHVAGGAANVALNCAALGGRATLIGIVGADPAADWLKQCLAQHSAVDVRLIEAGGRPTTLKTRYLGRRQQIVRVDREDSSWVSNAIVEAVLASVRDTLAETDILLISDYAKGLLADRLLRDVMAVAREAGVPVIVDPKRDDLSAYRGATIITPNSRELGIATGIDCTSDGEAERAAAASIETTGASIMLTRSELGISYFTNDSAPVHSPAKAREVFDVSGAGDTVIAAIALSLGAGVDIPRALYLANTAAGIAVGKHGTATVSLSELSHALVDARASDETETFVADRSTVAERIGIWKAAGLTVGFANGCFDLIHPGHIRLISAAAAACDRLIIALNSDASVKRLKGPGRPLQDETARAKVMASIKGVSLVTLFEEDTPRALIEALQPHILVKGSDYSEDQVVGGDIVKSYGGRVLLVDLEEGHSTTRIARRTQGTGN